MRTPCVRTSSAASSPSTAAPGGRCAACASTTGTRRRYARRWSNARTSCGAPRGRRRSPWPRRWTGPRAWRAPARAAAAAAPWGPSSAGPWRAPRGGPACGSPGSASENKKRRPPGWHARWRDPSRRHTLGAGGTPPGRRGEGGLLQSLRRARHRLARCLPRYVSLVMATRKRPLAVVATSSMVTRPVPRSVTTLPAATLADADLASTQSTSTDPDSMWLAILLRLMPKPALATASRRRLASTVCTLFLRTSPPPLSSASGTSRHVTGTDRTLDSSAHTSAAAGGASTSCAPRSPVTSTSPTASRLSPRESTAPRKSRWEAESKRKLPSTSTALRSSGRCASRSVSSSPRLNTTRCLSARG
mmetsp:Transcript_14380/g.48617  ORF Transcript_14380/g.48617 Transcript_14380/m.48617 type:complete len:361 (-) Transcript_14380:300-1382(-)